MAKKREFPTFAIILLVSGIIWGIESLGYFDIDFPWFPVVLVVIAIGMLIDRYRK